MRSLGYPPIVSRIFHCYSCSGFEKEELKKKRKKKRESKKGLQLIKNEITITLFNNKFEAILYKL